MTESKKCLSSLRLSATDIERIKALAKRLQVRELEIIRFALRLTLTKLAPLHHRHARGRDLIPVFLEFGPELMHHFHMDSRSLEAIINANLNDARERVEGQDIELLATSQAMPAYHFYSKFKGMPQLAADRLDLSAALQQYLYQKYIDPTILEDFDSQTNIKVIKQMESSVNVVG